MGLKELRQRRHLTQQMLADHLHTTQQTIARWENGKSPIPSAYLPKVAAFLGVPVEQLLSGGRDGRQYGEEAVTATLLTQAFGTLRAQLRIGVRDYPISRNQRDGVLRSLNDLDRDWLNFTSLDNRIVLINPVFVRSLDLITDDFEAMPFHAGADIYKLLTDADTTDAAITAAKGAGTLRELDRLIKALPDAVADPDDQMQSGADKVSLAMHYTQVFWSDGSGSRWLMEENDADWFDVIDGQGPRGFREIHTDGHDIHRFVNAAEAVVIEAPLQMYLKVRAGAETDK